MSNSPFHYINSINNKEYCWDDKFSPNEYKSYLVQLGFSNYSDTVLLANGLNIYTDCIPEKQQYDFLYHSISKRKRYGKWSKKDTVAEDLEMVQEYFDISIQKAKETLRILSDEQLQEIRELINVGGKS